MSVELSLLILNRQGVPPKGLWLCHENMYLATAYNRFIEACDTKELPKTEIPEPIHCHFDRIKSGYSEGEYCYGSQDKSNYGGPLYWTTVGDILNLAKKYPSEVEESTRIKAAMAYLGVLAHTDPEWRVVLWWH